MEEKSETIEKWLEELAEAIEKGERFSNKEVELIESYSEQFDHKAFLTDPQITALRNIHEAWSRRH